MRRRPSGITTTNLVFSAWVGTSDDLFPQILALHVPPRAAVADVTYGKGIFWKRVPPDRYRLLATDLAAGVDCRNLPYQDGSIDCVVFDPPLIEGFYRRRPEQRAGASSFSALRSTYAPCVPLSGKAKYHQALIELYQAAGAEFWRVLRERGVLIVKCQDEVSANTQHLTHVEIINLYQAMGFYTKDLFILVRRNRPAVSRIKRQQHARKNHSYFIVFVKPRARKTCTAAPPILSDKCQPSPDSCM